MSWKKSDRTSRKMAKVLTKQADKQQEYGNSGGGLGISNAGVTSAHVSVIGNLSSDDYGR